MAVGTRDANAFYQSPLGVLTAALLRRELLAWWPALTDLSVLGIGYAGPYLELWRQQARCVALVPAYVEARPWPQAAPCLTCVAETESLPFADLSFDRILLVHGLEQAGHARRLLREVWRVLKDDGRLVVLVPNRRGLWAHVETTPFGHGQPYSEGQLARLLSGLSFQVERHKTALYAPPFEISRHRHLFGVLEKCGPYVAPHFAGLVLAEAVKVMGALAPLGPRASVGRVIVANDA